MKNLKSWLLGSLPGILAILFGIIALAFPSITVFALVIYYAISIIIGGVILIFISIKIKKKKPNWAFTLLEGIIGILFGLIILAWPELAAVVLIAIIGIWSLFMGLIFISTYFVKSISKGIRYIYLFAGLISLLFGLLIILNPFKGTRAVIILIGLYAISYGIFSIINNSKENYLV